MTEISSHAELNDEEQYPLLTPDPLGILQSTRTVLLEGEHVWINQPQLLQLAARWIQEPELIAAQPWLCHGMISIISMMALRGR